MGLVRGALTKATFANVTALLALVVAVGGSSIASGAFQDKSGRISACYVKKGNADKGTSTGEVQVLLKGTKCDKGEKKFSFNSQGPTGPAGATGAQGLKGDTGLQGDPGMSGYVQVNGFSAGDSSPEQGASATCPQGTKVVGGGAVTNTGGSTVDLALTTSIPLSDGSGWSAKAVETTTHAGTWAVNARAICVNVAP